MLQEVEASSWLQFHLNRNSFGSIRGSQIAGQRTLQNNLVIHADLLHFRLAEIDVGIPPVVGLSAVAAGIILDVDVDAAHRVSIGVENSDLSDHWPAALRP